MQANHQLACVFITRSGHCKRVRWWKSQKQKEQREQIYRMALTMDFDLHSALQVWLLLAVYQ